MVDDEMTEQEWFEKYHPILNTLVDDAPFHGRMFQNYGPEMEFVKSQDLHKVWTICEDDENEWYRYIPGIHSFNVTGYFVCSNPWVQGQVIPAIVEY